MSIQRLPGGRYRAQVYDAATGKNVSVGKILGGSSTFDTRKQADRARSKARVLLENTNPAHRTVTVSQWQQTWSTDPLYQRPKPSTNIHNHERVRAFCAAHADLPLTAVDDLVVARWLAGGKRTGQVPALRAMFNDAASAKAGRLVKINPFAGLGIKRGRGNRDTQPPSETTVTDLITAAKTTSTPSLAAWLQVAAYTGMRPGELDALAWDDVDMTGRRIRVHRQWNATARCFTLPKNGMARWALITPKAYDALAGLRDGEHDYSEFCFTTARRSHWTPSARASHWKAVRATVGYTGTLYLATRHFAGWYMTNVLLLPAEDVAIALGHEDGGALVRKLYGHRDRDLALKRVQRAYEDAAQVVSLNDRRKAAGQ